MYRYSKSWSLRHIFHRHAFKISSPRIYRHVPNGCSQCALRSTIPQESFRARRFVLPRQAKLETILAKDFRDLENGYERSKGREDIIELVVSRQSRYSKYQTDLTQAWCITNSNKTQTVLFESIRFIVFQRDTEWVRIPLAGRLEVRACTVDGKLVAKLCFVS